MTTLTYSTDQEAAIALLARVVAAHPGFRAVGKPWVTRLNGIVVATIEYTLTRKVSMETVAKWWMKECGGVQRWVSIALLGE